MLFRSSFTAPSSSEMRLRSSRSSIRPWRTPRSRSRRRTCASCFRSLRAQFADLYRQQQHPHGASQASRTPVPRFAGSVRHHRPPCFRTAGANALCHLLGSRKVSRPPKLTATSPRPQPSFSSLPCSCPSCKLLDIVSSSCVRLW